MILFVVSKTLLMPVRFLSTLILAIPTLGSLWKKPFRNFETQYVSQVKILQVGIFGVFLQKETGAENVAMATT